MSLSFNAAQGLIVVPTRLWEPAGDAIVRLALDTGATGSAVNTQLLALLGYQPGAAATHVRITTGSGVARVPRLAVDRIEALGQTKLSFAAVAHTLPPSATVDGVLGLDFFRGSRLVIDFRAGLVTLQ